MCFSREWFRNLGLTVLMALALSGFSKVHAADLASDPKIPAGAKRLIPSLNQAMKDSGYPKVYHAKIAGQIEQETCITLKHSKCWNEKATLKTHREFGFGLGQFTTAYNPDGSVRFSVFDELRALPELAGWNKDTMYDGYYQLKAILIKDRQSEAGILAEDDFQHMSMGKAVYNGGRGDLLKAKKKCRLASDCNDKRWYGANGKKGVRDYNVKSTIKVKGYGQSFRDINNTYVDNIMLPGGRSDKYEPYVGPTRAM